MDRKSMAIGVLSTTALVLLAATFWGGPARADTAVSDREYQMVTAQTGDHGDALYVIDNRTGKVVVFAWDNASHTLRPVASRTLTDMFGR